MCILDKKMKKIENLIIMINILMSIELIFFKRKYKSFSIEYLKT